MRGEEPGVRGQGPHVIRLRGPWTTDAGVRVKLPATWAETLGEAESATLARPFNRPTNLDGIGVSVVLRVESPQSVKRILLNGAPIADGDDVRGALESSNRLDVDLSRRDREAPILEAWLEIHERAQ